MSTRIRTVLLALFLAASASLLFAAIGDGEWLKQVPDKARTRSNPLSSAPDTTAGGGRLFVRHCAQCHGEDAHGVKGKPDLHTERVRNATPGELEWLLRNGSLKNGMPEWSGLPEGQRWQLVSYLKTLK